MCENDCSAADPVERRYVAVNATIVLTFSERLLLAERVIYVVVAAILAWFILEVRVNSLEVTYIYTVTVYNDKH